MLLWALTVHEWAHAFSAHKCGDDTAFHQGRMTLNPLAHLDPLGTLMMVLSFFSSAIPLGWAKPVPVNPLLFKYPSRDDIIVSLAGVTANLVNAIGFAIIFRLLVHYAPGQDILLSMAVMGVYVNIGLLFFNVIPIPPLDGSHVLESYLPYHMKEAYHRIMPYGMYILIGLIYLGATTYLVGIPTLFVSSLLLSFGNF